MTKKLDNIENDPLNKNAFEARMFRRISKFGNQKNGENLFL